MKIAVKYVPDKMRFPFLEVCVFDLLLNIAG